MILLTTHLFPGLFTIALEIFWSMKNSNDRENPSPIPANTAPQLSLWRGATAKENELVAWNWYPVKIYPQQWQFSKFSRISLQGKDNTSKWTVMSRKACNCMHADFNKYCKVSPRLYCKLHHSFWSEIQTIKVSPHSFPQVDINRQKPYKP